MRKLLALFLALLMILSLVACASTQDTTKNHRHTYAAKWNKDATHHWHECSDPKCSEISEKDEHSWDDGEITTPATKTEDGVITYTCTYCGQTKTGIDAAYGKPLPSNEDEMLAYIMDALNSSYYYGGDITVSLNRIGISSSEQGTEKQESVQATSTYLTYDASNKVCYSLDKEIHEDGTVESFNKTFINGDSLYIASKVVSNDASTELNYSKIHDSARADYEEFDNKQNFAIMSEVYKGIQLADSVDEIRASYASTLPKIIAASFNLNGNTASTQKISAAEYDGGYKLAIAFEISVSELVNEMPQTASITLDSSLIAKDEMISSFEMNITVSSSEGEGENKESQSTTYKMAMSYDYSFSKEAYDSLTVTLPENTADIPTLNDPETATEAYFKMYLNGEEIFENYLTVGNDPKEIYDKIIKETIKSSEKATVKLYKDVEKIEEISRDTVTKSELLALKKIYIDVTPDSNSVIIIQRRSTREEFSRPYQITIPILYFISSQLSYFAFPYCTDTLEYTFSEQDVNDEYREIWINGERQDPKPTTLTLEGGKIYVFETIIVRKDNNL